MEHVPIAALRLLKDLDLSYCLQREFTNGFIGMAEENFRARLKNLVVTIDPRLIG
jgi:hypothetical protein